MDNQRKVIALGFFDGVHLGHGALLRRVAQRAAELRGLLIQELAGREEGYSDGERLIVGCTPKTVLDCVSK